jgi:hypothetical protein
MSLDTLSGSSPPINGCIRNPQNISVNDRNFPVLTKGGNLSLGIPLKKQWIILVPIPESCWWF